jgi:hypothetical protein
MGAKINEIIAGEYDHKGKAVIYGDSVTGDTLIRTHLGSLTIEQMFDACLEHKTHTNGKEYGMWSPHKVVGFHSHDMQAMVSEVETVIRHKTQKHLFRVITANGKHVTVTEDHSLMVDRHGFLMEITPTQLMPHDLMITLDMDQDLIQHDVPDVEYTTVSEIQDLGVIHDYVYDISIRDADPIFFANDCAVKNTDSIYFSAHPVMKDQPEFADFEWSKEAIVQLYDQIADITNDSFPGFMQQSFHVDPKNSVIKAGRELVATEGLFITKKRYAVLIYDKEGKRKDVKGKPGEIKVMGLDIKRSDTPKPVQEFLYSVLESVLTGATQDQIFEQIKQFRTEFTAWPSWAKGSPKRVNNLTHYGKLMHEQEGGMKNAFDQKHAKSKAIPGHVRASLNYNRLREINSDQQSIPIQDGFKVIVCKLKPNALGFTSIAFPTDLDMIPDWFKALPFDDEAMSEALITKKLENLLGVLGWNLNEAQNNHAFDQLFSF